MAAAMAGAKGGVDGRGRRGEEEKTVALCGAGNLASTRCEEGEEEKTVALCGAGNLASTRCEEGSDLCVNPLDWVFQHWSSRSVTSRHNDCLTKRAVGERAGKQAHKKFPNLVSAGSGPPSLLKITNTRKNNKRLTLLNKSP